MILKIYRSGESEHISYRQGNIGPETRVPHQVESRSHIKPKIDGNFVKRIFQTDYAVQPEYVFRGARSSPFHIGAVIKADVGTEPVIPVQQVSVKCPVVYLV